MASSPTNQSAGAQTRKATDGANSSPVSPAKRAKTDSTGGQDHDIFEILEHNIVSLPHLPAELVDTIAISLTTSDLGNLRLTCKDVECKTRYRFCHENFSEKRFMHSNYAFERLVKISKSRMAQYVRTLHLGPPSCDHGEIRYFDDLDEEKRIDEDTRNKITQKLRASAHENRIMKAFGEDAKMLLSAFKGLRNLVDLIFVSLDDIDEKGLSFGELFPWDESYRWGRKTYYLDPDFDDMPHEMQSHARLFLIALGAVEQA